jgi:hypothetical protein
MGKISGSSLKFSPLVLSYPEENSPELNSNQPIREFAEVGVAVFPANS